jgi:hypothetical protein
MSTDERCPLEVANLCKDLYLWDRTRRVWCPSQCLPSNPCQDARHPSQCLIGPKP